MVRSRFLSALSGAFAPPFRYLPLLVWGFFVWCFLAHPQMALWQGAFADSDDMVHLVRVTDWLQGQNWFDPVLRRLAPPEGVSIHFSRLAEWPLAAIMGSLHAFGVGWTAAAYLASGIWPLVLLVFFLMAVAWAAKPFLPRDWERLALWPALFAIPLMAQFSPGRVDHHGLAMILVLMAFGCAVRLMQEPHVLKWALGGGFFLAFGQAVALETLPWVLAFSGWVGVLVTLKGKGYAGTALVFGFALYVFSLLFLAVTVSPSGFFDLNPLAYSWLYVLLAGTLAVFLGVAAMTALYGKAWMRFAAGIGIVGASAVLLLAFFPTFLSRGPYAGMDPQLASLMLSSINEAVPLTQRTESYAVFFASLFFCSLGLGTSLGFMLKSKEDEELWTWLFVSLSLLAAVFLTVAYQARFLFYADLLSIAPLSVLLYRSLLWARQRFRGRRLAAMELFLILLVGPIAGVLIPASADGRSFNKGVLLFPVVFEADMSCAPPGLWQLLSLPNGYGSRPRRIMNTMNEGGALLFHTPHNVFSAPYHTNVKGNLESIRFFQEESPNEAKKIAQKNQIDLVLVCKDLPSLYKNANKALLWKEGTGFEARRETFAEQLVEGRIPSWLKPVRMPFLDKALLFEVIP